MPDKLLIVDDQRHYGEFIAKVGKQAGYEVQITERADEFLGAIDAFAPTVLTIDLMMPEGDGIALLKDLAKRKCKAAILLTSGLDVRTLGWADTLGREIGLHIAGTVPKPVRAADLRTTLEGLKRPA